MALPRLQLVAPTAQPDPLALSLFLCLSDSPSASQVILTPFCVGSRTVNVPIVAPMAAPPELGEELGLRVGFVGSGATARIEAAEVRTKMPTLKRYHRMRWPFVFVSVDGDVSA